MSQLWKLTVPLWIQTPPPTHQESLIPWFECILQLLKVTVLLVV